jgi:hypothetical protein
MTILYFDRPQGPNNLADTGRGKQDEASPEIHPYPAGFI